jgi:hypothetical protein
MLRLLGIVLVAAALPGCASNYIVYGSTFGAAPVASGTSIVVNGGLVASISLGASAANVLAGVGIVTLLAAGNGLSPVPAPAMRENREINEQDCTAPIVNLTANLRCR